ncbi:LamG domain-containing protein [Candidatus Woesearchaeota archaeon]|nr:LamG domain-containing protein [Candidatus Woesearchaeota archaeon]
MNSTLYNTSSIFGNSPSTAYYPEGLKLLWDGSDLINKVNTSHVATIYQGGGELIVGAYTEANGNFTDSHMIDRVATQFDSSSDYIIFPNIDSLIGTYPTEFTISQWVKTEKWTSSILNYYWIFYNGTPFTGLIKTNFEGASGQIPYFSLYNSSGGISTAQFPSNFGPSSRPTLWDFMAITYDGVNITYYFNYTKVNTFIVGSSASIEGYGFALGNANGAILDIDEVAIFNRSLSGSEIASLYELQRFAFDDGGITHGN